eukprot:10756122-Alexandrium_andersonii.AAC.1
MSASLVGSEMCIRDRSSGERSSAAAELQLELQSTPIRGRAAGEAELLVPCLLYTSDAADDM